MAYSVSPEMLVSMYLVMYQLFKFDTHTHFSQFLMPGLVDCHFHPSQYFRAGADIPTFFNLILGTFVPGDLMFRNTTYAREESVRIVVCIVFVLSIHCRGASKLWNESTNMHYSRLSML